MNDSDGPTIAIAELVDRVEAFAHLLEDRAHDPRIDRASSGEPALTPTLARKLLQEFAKPGAAERTGTEPDALTDREREVLELMVEGITSNRKLAKRLNLSENTVKFHVRNILDKLRLNNRAQAVGYAMRHRISDREGTK